MIISFLNYTGEKNNLLNSKQFNDIKSLSEINDKNFLNYLYSRVYDSVLSIPIQINFGRSAKKIFKKPALYIKEIHYKNYYLIDLTSDKIILSLETLHDKNNGKEPMLKANRQKKLWNELIFHCHNLENDYIKKNNMTFNGVDYQNFFVKIEYKVTYPRRNFIIKFLPLLNGMCIIHEYIQLKLSTFENEEKKKYNEKKIIYGYDAYDNIFRNSDNRYFENEHYFLKQVHFFIIESLFCSNTSLHYFFILVRKPKIYFSEEILKIIDNEIKIYLKNEKSKGGFNYNCTNDIINKIINALYEEYIQINNNEKVIHKSSQEISRNQKNDLILKEIQDMSNKNKSLKITKNETLIFLFNSIQFNKNINPNDITLDLNDERISQLRLTHNESNEFPSPRRSDLINKKERPNSIRLSELLSENQSIKPSKETMKSTKSNNSIDNKFPFDSKEKEKNILYNDYNETEQPLNKEEYIEGNSNEKNKQRFSHKMPQDTANNTNNIIYKKKKNNNKKEIIEENNISYYNNDYSNYHVNISDNNNEIINIDKEINNNGIINDNNYDEESNDYNVVNNNIKHNNLYEEAFGKNEMKKSRNSYNNGIYKEKSEENNNNRFNGENDEYFNNNYSIKNFSSKKNLRKNYKDDEFDSHDINDSNDKSDINENSQ